MPSRLWRSSLAGQKHSLANDKKGRGRLLRLLAALPVQRPAVQLQVVLEASGGDEAALGGGAA